MSFQDQIIISIIDKLLIGVLIAVAAYILNRRLEKFKQELNAQTKEYETELQSYLKTYESQLQKLVKEHELRFSSLHQKRVEVIAGLYVALEESKLHTEFLVLRAKHVEAKNLKPTASFALKSWSEASQFYKKNKLYFPKELSQKLDTVIREIIEPTSMYRNWEQNPEEYAEVLQNIREWWSNKSSEINAVLKAIEEEFRMILGSEDNAASNNSFNPTPR
ncbi:MAG TPA: hypothetical protein VF708_18530 [Pyrinomonadaceae bacterium]|jgi:hypothetical protein